MEISEVRVKMVANNKDDLTEGLLLDDPDSSRHPGYKDHRRGRGFASGQCVGKMSDHCEKCGGKNHPRKYCNNCGRCCRRAARQDLKGRAKLHADIAHPINAACRKRIQDAIVAAYESELERSKLPGYKPVDLDDYDYESDAE